MDFDLSEDQKMLVDTAASFAKKESPVTRLRAMRDDAVGWSKATWKQMGELGWLGILLPESVGGLGWRFVDAALVLEQLGTTLVPEPYVPSCVLGGQAVARLGDARQHERWLAPMCAGDTTLALAWAERQGRYDVARVSTRADKKGDRFVLTGEKVFVLNGHAADALVVSARTAGAEGDRAGVSLFAIDRGAPGVTVRPVKTMDGHHAAHVSLSGATVGADALLGAAGGAADVLRDVVDLGAAAACAEGVGILRTVLAMTVDYLKTREQFGVKIGTFQALQHRAVDMFIQTELMKSMNVLAALNADAPDAVDRMGAISAAKVQLATSGRYVTQQSIQLHGGIGVTDEHDVGLYFKRMTVLNALYGDEEFHLRRYATLPSFTA